MLSLWFSIVINWLYLITEDYNFVHILCMWYDVVNRNQWKFNFEFFNDALFYILEDDVLDIIFYSKLNLAKHITTLKELLIKTKFS